MNRYKLLKHYVNVTFSMYDLKKFAKKLSNVTDSELETFESIELGNAKGIKGENYWFKKIILASIDRMEKNGTKVTGKVLTKEFNLDYIAKYGEMPPALKKN